MQAVVALFLRWNIDHIILAARGTFKFTCKLLVQSLLGCAYRYNIIITVHVDHCIVNNIVLAIYHLLPNYLARLQIKDASRVQESLANLWRHLSFLCPTGHKFFASLLSNQVTEKWWNNSTNWLSTNLGLHIAHWVE